MKFNIKSCFVVCLLSVTASVFAAQVPCPLPETVALYSEKIDTVQNLGWSYALISGTDLFANPFYDDQSARNWRLVAHVALDNGGYSSAFKRGIILTRSVTTNVNKYADEQQPEGVYICKYARGNQNVEVMAFSPINGEMSNSQILKSLVK